MPLIDKLVKEAFIEIYFKNGNYLKLMHEHIVNQIKSYTETIKDSKGLEHVNINGKDFVIPQIPESFTNDKVMKEFIEGLLRSKNFIS